MSKLRFITPGKCLNFRLFVLFVLLFSAQNLLAQTVPDFSGVWIQDTTKSDDFYKAFDVKSSIAQTAKTFTIKTTFSDKNGEVLDTRESTFNLDGKEVISEEGKARKSATWSSDKKTLSTKDTKDYGGDTVGVNASYTLSADGLVLTVKTSDIKAFGPSITQVFNRKK